MADTGRDPLPLKDVVLCSTSLPQDVRIRLADVAQQMGATHLLDLTGEVTHLVVGENDTAKYKYVAKERPDITVLDPAWIDAVRDVWMDGGDVDVEGLEKMHRYPTFAGLKICISGYPNQTERNQISSTIEHEGAEYHGDLTKKVTHLLVAAPEGAKYRAAREWGVHAVSIKWLHDSIQRGMALDPRYYDPTMAEEEQGKGAYRKEPRTSLGKRARNDETQAAANEIGKRKLRRVASRRLEDHSQDMWQDISAADVTTVALDETDQWTAGDEDSQLTLGRSKPQPPGRKSFDAQQDKVAEVPPKPDGLFSGWRIAIQGFEKDKAKRLTHYLEPNGAQVVRSPKDLNASEDGQDVKCCLLVPHAQPKNSTNIEQAPSGAVTATEWWVERCVHYKQILEPKEDALSQPLWNLNIMGFSKLTLSTTGFSGVDYRQVAEAIKLAGATYQDQLAPTTSILVSGSSSVKKEKAFYASKHNVPIVTAEWLWSCLKSKRKASLERYKVELPTHVLHDTSSRSARSSPAPSDTLKRTGSTGTKKDTQAQTRLSNTRKRQPTPSLPLQQPKPSANVPKSAGPFVHEDDDDDDDDNNNESAPPFVLDDENESKSTSSKNAPLQVLSPNASPRKQLSADNPKTTPPTEKDATTDEAHETDAPSPAGDEPLAKAPTQPPHRPQADWAADLASLVEKQQRRTASSENNTPAQRLKNRRLGRAPSGSSFTNRINSGSAAANQDLHPGETSFSDSGDSASAPPQEELPSTQIGYETLEAEAARMQMAKRMGLSYSDEGPGTRLASLGVVRDSAGPPGGRARNRTRK